MSSWRRVAADGAVVTVDAQPSGWAVNCTVCGFVCSDPGDERWVIEQAEYHDG